MVETSREKWHFPAVASFPGVQQLRLCVNNNRGTDTRRSNIIYGSALLETYVESSAYMYAFIHEASMSLKEYSRMPEDDGATNTSQKQLQNSTQIMCYVTKNANVIV